MLSERLKILFYTLKILFHTRVRDFYEYFLNTFSLLCVCVSDASTYFFLMRKREERGWFSFLYGTEDFTVIFPMVFL